MKKKSTAKSADKSKEEELQLQQQQQQQAELGKQELIQLLFQRTEDETAERFSDKKLDRENEKILLLSGKEISIREIKAFVSGNLQTYSPKFPRDFYREINRLNGWNIPESELHYKPFIVARFTKEIVYGRFCREVLPTLQQLNPYVGFGVRAHKHFQWLTPEGEELLIKYISEAVEMMKKCSTWHEFKVRYGKQYGIPFQSSIFDRNDYSE